MDIENKEFAESVREVRETIINEGYIGLLMLLLPSLLITLIGSKQGIHKEITMIFIILFIVIGSVFMFRSRVHYYIRVWLIILVSYILGIHLFVSSGLIGLGCLFMALSNVVVTLHNKKKTIIFFFYLSIAIYSVLGILFFSGYIQLQHSPSDIINSKFVWTACICTFAMVVAFMVRSIQALNIFMTDSIKKLRTRNSELERLSEELSSRLDDIYHLAYYDTLTQIPNRASFEKQVSVLIHDSEDGFPLFNVIYIDLDDFKVINKLMGHRIGDQVIHGIASQLYEVFASEVMVARMGGDEMAVLVKRELPADEIKAMNDEVRKVLNQVSQTLNVPYKLSCSMGVTRYPEDGNTYDELLQNVDTALYEAKKRGKARYFIYNDGLRRELDERLMMQTALITGLDNGELTPYYQPKYDAKTGEIVSFEALARWESVEYGMVSPGVFIPLLENMGFIYPFGKMIMKEALIQLKQWHSMGYESLSMAVNVSALQFREKNFYEDTCAMIKEIGISPESLEIEITESILIDDMESVKEKLLLFSRMGVKISLDDFGTGYSSLNYLRTLPIDILKIDKSFVDVINSHNQEEFILPTIIDLAHALSLKVVAEGIEDVQQKIFLEVNGCDYLQGFYLCKPSPAAVITQLLKEKEAKEKKGSINTNSEMSALKKQKFPL